MVVVWLVVCVVVRLDVGDDVCVVLGDVVALLVSDVVREDDTEVVLVDVWVVVRDVVLDVVSGQPMKRRSISDQIGGAYIT